MILVPADFSQFFNRRGPLPIPNTVTLIVDEHVIECSGPILAKHSPVLFHKLREGSKVFLDEFSGMVEGVLDCIEMLYGSDVVISLKNLQALMKFSILFKVEGMHELCVKWVQENISLDTFNDFFKVSHFVFTLEQSHGGGLEACRALILKDEPGKTVEELRKGLDAQDTDQTNMMLFFLEQGLMDYTLPIVIDWIDSDKKVSQVIDTVESKHLFEPLVTLFTTPECQGLQFIKKLFETTDNFESASRVGRLQSRVMESTLEKVNIERCVSNVRLNTHLYGIELIDLLLPLSKVNHAHYVEWCITNSRPNHKHNARAVWPNINPKLLGKSVCDNVQREVNTRIDSSLRITYPVGEDIKDGYYKAATKEQCAQLKAMQPVTMLFDCQMDGCTMTSPHAITIKLSKTNCPCYDLNIIQVKDPAVECHVHPGQSVLHWYICWDNTPYGSGWEYVSLATKTYDQVITYLGLKGGSYPLSVMNIGCIMKL